MKSLKKRPVIGITLDHEESGSYSKYPWYAARQNYSQVVANTGGTPVFLPHESKLAEQYASLIDGLIITGGAFDVSPSLYSNEEVHKTVTLKERRTDFEIAITRDVLKRDKPILGICGGQQLLNVVLGGTLIQHIPNEI